jgi:Protein of unknown function (DUF3108)
VQHHSTDCSYGRRPAGGGAPRRTLCALAAAMALAVSSVVAADELKPFEASYAWIWHGMTVAVTTLKLEKSGDDTWTYTSRSEPRGIGKVLSQRPKTVSVLKVTDAGVQPLSYKGDDGTSSTKRAVDIKYDWQAHRVTGIYEEVKVDLPLKSGVQDDSSVQVAMMVELLAGRTPDRFSLIDKNSVREYRYTREGEDNIDTALGKVPTVVFRSQRANSPHANRYWCAPDRGFIPMKVQQKRDDEVQWSMQVLTLKRE